MMALLMLAVGLSLSSGDVVSCPPGIPFNGTGCLDGYKRQEGGASPTAPSGSTELSASLPSLGLYWTGMENSAGTPWELDFMRELFPPPRYNHSRFADYANLPSVVTCGSRSNRDMIGRLLDHKKTSNKALRIIVHISDEFMGTNRDSGACDEIYSRFDLVLRCYAYHGNPVKHMLQLPLGYMVDMLTEPDPGVVSGAKEYKTDSNSQSLKRIHHSSLEYVDFSLTRTAVNRSYFWTFVGGMHGKGRKDREEMLNVFGPWEPHQRVNHTMHPREVRDMYNSTRFVLVGRGWWTLDCFKVYEAIISGAIPVVVGSRREIDHTFNFNGNKPPLLFADTWRTALDAAKRMTEREIDDRRAELAVWYRHVYTKIKNAIDKVMTAT